MLKNGELSRHIAGQLRDALSYSPVALIHGARQCGKTTLAQQVGRSENYGYINFDEEAQRTAAQTDPAGFVADLPPKVILDEVQRVPGLFATLKYAIDKNRVPGRFILTGSANILLLPKLSDSLAGRMSILRLQPLSQAELAKTAGHFLPTVFGGKFKRDSSHRRLGKKLADRIVAGGYPAALKLKNERHRTAWYRDYVDTLVQRDIRILMRIGRMEALSRLLELAAGHTAQLLNSAQLAVTIQASRPSVREYIYALAKIFLLEELPPYHNNRISRLIKTPKLHINDTGLACALLGLNSKQLWAERTMFGRMLETFIYQELRRQADAGDITVRFCHFRDKDQVEVDFVLESGGRIAGVEVKAAATVTNADFRGLRKLQTAEGKRFAMGVVLYDGETVLPFGKGMSAVPICHLWHPTPSVAPFRI